MHGKFLLHLSLFFKMNKNREYAEMLAQGQFLYNHAILKLVLSLPIGKVLTVFLHIQNAIPRIRIPRHGAISRYINCFLSDTKQTCPSLDVELTPSFTRSHRT